jgi:hypothetical protein
MPKSMTQRNQISGLVFERDVVLFLHYASHIELARVKLDPGRFLGLGKPHDREIAGASD